MKKILFLFIFLIICLHSRSFADGDNYFISLYVGRATDKDFQKLAVFEYGKYIDSKIIVVSLGKEIYDHKDLFNLEIEGQVGKHWEYQHHWEMNVVLSVRWNKFPWDDYLDTSFAMGDGFSYAFADPEIEVDDMGRTSKLLNYLLLEWSFSVFEPHWSVFSRIHHRSGIYGLINNVSGGSNMVTGGIRYSF